MILSDLPQNRCRVRYHAGQGYLPSHIASLIKETLLPEDMRLPSRVRRSLADTFEWLASRLGHAGFAP